MKLIESLHGRLGDLWWYTLLLFVVQRFGDVINLFVGLWVVPKYVSQQDLGAVLPLTQFVSLIGLPLGIVAIPFMKYLNVYAERNELGKIKALLRDVFIGTGIMAVATFVIAYFALPLLFDRMRIVGGSLGILIVAVSILSAISVIFQNAVQGLKLFSATVWFGVLSAPLRLLFMVVFMPFRPLSGYFVGQSAAPGVSLLGAIFVLRKKLGRSVRAVLYWREDGLAMLRYTIPVAAITIANVVGTSVDQLIIRHRLSDFDSAGYYIISRFADIASYLGCALVLFMFPLVAGRENRDGESHKILLHSVFGSAFGGALVAIALWLGGGALLGLQEHWCAYESLSDHMAFLALVNALNSVVACFIAYETARGRFRFLWYAVPIIAMKAVGLYLITGYTFFIGMVPQSWIAALDAFNPNRLGFLLEVFFAVDVLLIVFFAADVFGRERRSP